MSTAAVAKPPPSRRITVTSSLTLEQDDILRGLANLRFKGNRSKAISHLIDLYCGKETEKEIERAKSDPYEEPQAAIRWKPPTLTLELVGFVAGLVRAGNMPESACSLAGITPRQQSTWMKTGRNDQREGRQSLHADFVAAIRRAEAECEAEDIKRLREHGQATWTALAWRLERQYPDRYAQRKRIDGKVQHSLMPLVDYDRLTAAETKTLVELLRKASPELDDPSVGRSSRPAIELVPEDVIDAVDGQWHELVEPEAPALESGPPESAPAEAPSLETDSAEAPSLEKPEH